VDPGEAASMKAQDRERRKLNLVMRDYEREPAVNEITTGESERMGKK
jgi:hypothetical protein